MNDVIPLFYDCGCVIRLGTKRKLDSFTLCDTHHSSLKLSETVNRILGR